MKEESEGQSHVKCTGLALGGRRGQKTAQRRGDPETWEESKEVSH